MIDNTAEQLKEKPIEIFTLPEEIRDPLVLAELVDKEAAHYLFQSFFPHLPLDMIKDINCGSITVRVDNWAHGYARLLDENVDHMSPEWRIHFAQIVMRCGDEEGAIKLVEQAYKEDPELMDGFARLGGLYRLHSYWAGAHNLMKKDVELDRISWFWKLQYAEIVAELESMQNAVSLVESVYKEHPEATDGFAILGGVFNRQGKSLNAYEYLYLDYEKNKLSAKRKLLLSRLTLRCLNDLNESKRLVAEAYSEDKDISDGYAILAMTMISKSSYYSEYDQLGLIPAQPAKNKIVESAILLFNKDDKLQRLTPIMRTTLARLYAQINNEEKAIKNVILAEKKQKNLTNSYAKVQSGLVLNDKMIKPYIMKLKKQLLPNTSSEESAILIEAISAISPKKTKPSVILFGASTAGRNSFHKLNGWCEIIGFCDNDIKKQGEIILGKPIFSPEHLSDMQYDKIIVCSMYENEIIKQLVDDLKISDKKIERANLPLSVGLLRKMANVSYKEDVDLRYLKFMTEVITTACNSYHSFKNCDDSISIIANYVKRLPSVQEKSKKITPNEKPTKIALCAQRIKAGHQDSHVYHFFAIAAELAKYADAEVHIIATHENQLHEWRSGFIPYQTQLNKYYVQKIASSIIDETYLQRIKLHYLDSIGIDTIIKTAEKIIDINPDVVIYPSGRIYGNESTAIRRVIHNFIPSVFIFTNHIDPADKYNDLIIASTQHKINTVYNNLPVRIQLQPGFESRWKNLIYNKLSKNNQVMISTMAGNRMAQAFKTMPEKTIQSLVSILDNVSSCTWYLVGASNINALINSHPLIRHYAKKRRIIVLPRLLPNEFESLISKSQLYLCPPNFYGGSASSIIACRYGVPILCFSDSDIASRQPSHLVFKDNQINEFIELAIKALLNEETHRMIVAEQHDWIRYLGQSRTENFYNLLCLAAKNSKSRFHKNLSGT